MLAQYAQMGQTHAKTTRFLFPVQTNACRVFLTNTNLVTTNVHRVLTVTKHWTRSTILYPLKQHNAPLAVRASIKRAPTHVLNARTVQTQEMSMGAL